MKEAVSPSGIQVEGCHLSYMTWNEPFMNQSKNAGILYGAAALFSLSESLYLNILISEFDFMNLIFNMTN